MIQSNKTVQICKGYSYQC